MPSHIPDPAPRDEPLYECPKCGRRGTREDGRRCPDCGVERRNIAVPRHR